MVTTIHEPALSCADAAPIIERTLRNLLQTCTHQPGPLYRTTLNNLKVHFWSMDKQATRFSIRDGFNSVLAGTLDPPSPSRYPGGQFRVGRWWRGQWEGSFGVPLRSYDPHWNDHVPLPLKEAVEVASQSAGSFATQRLVQLMTSYVDGSCEDVIDLMVQPSEHAGEYGCLAVNAMKGPNMAAIVPLMMWANGVAASDVLRVYIEAHDNKGVRRQHIGMSKRITAFFGYMTGITELSSFVKFLRTKPNAQTTALIMQFCQSADPNLARVFPAGLAAFLQGCAADPSIDVHSVVRRRSGLFS